MKDRFKEELWTLGNEAVSPSEKPETAAPLTSSLKLTLEPGR